MKIVVRYRLAQILIGLVVFFNLQSAVSLLVSPQAYAPAFEVEGVGGQGMVRGIGLLFLMWNVPYLVALINPIKFRVSLYESVAMQLIGLVGEILLLQTIPIAHTLIHASVSRFIIFDSGGLIALLLSMGLSRSIPSPSGLGSASHLA